MIYQTRSKIWLWGCAVLIAVSSLVSAQVPVSPKERVAAFKEANSNQVNSALEAAQDETTVEVKAVQLEFDTDTQIFRGVGNVVIQYGEDLLLADEVIFNNETHWAEARGNVIIEHRGDVWSGDKIRYNVKTGEGIPTGTTFRTDPYIIDAETASKQPGKIILNRATITTCEGPNPDFHIRARQATIENNTKLRAEMVTVFLGPIPIFFTPFLVKNLGEDTSHWDFVPGYSSEMGGYLLSAYNFHLTPELRAATHLDYRSKRGFGIGQDLLWGNDDTWYGALKTYYLNDDEPFEDMEEEMARGDLVDEQRYRVRLSHFHSMSPDDTLIAEVNYLSDPDVVEDFFDEEFRGNAQPENRVTLTHRDEWFTTSLELNARLNDFYDNLNRLPEVRFDIHRQPMGETGFYYESANAASFLDRVFSDQSSEEDYDASRVDSSHRILYPFRKFGFLNLIPSVGYRGTYYSKTRSSSIITNMVTTVDTNGVSSTTNEVSTLNVDGGAELRNILEFGFETSFKAFKVLHNDPLYFGQGLRHVTEPYAAYSMIPEPSIEPDELFQFDGVDRIGERNQVRLGVRNKLQTKMTGGLHDLVDLNTFADYNFIAESDEDALGPLGVDLDLRPLSWINMETLAIIDWREGELARIDTELELIRSDRSRVGVEHRYTADRRNLFASHVSLWPDAPWSLSAYWRYEFETSELEEQRYAILHKSDCLGLGLGVKQIDEDVTVWAQIWLLAFPETQIDLGR